MKGYVEFKEFSSRTNEADLKKMLVCFTPTYPPKTGPTQKMLLPFFSCFFFNFPLILLTNHSLKSLKAVLYLKKGYRDCYYMHSYLIYSICRPLKVIVRRGHKIMLNF